MKTIEANVISASDSMPDIEFINVELSDQAQINISRGVETVVANTDWINCLDVKHNGSKLIAMREEEPVEGVRLELFTFTVDATGTVMVRAWLKTNMSEYVDAEFTLK